MRHYNSKLKNLFFLGFFFVIFLFSLFAFHLRFARAQTGGNTMTVIPPRLEISAKPGEIVKKTIQFRNESEETAYLSVSVKDFLVKTDNGQPEFVSEPASGRWAASSWIKLNPLSAAVLPKTISNFNLTINVPADALPGGHYAGVLYQTTGSPAQIRAGIGAGSGITQVVGTLVYITVAGPVKENAIVKRFAVPGFSEYGPISFTTEISNLSDVHIRPAGQITVRNLFGQVAAQLKLDERNIFPGASLVYQNTWPEKFVIGRFRADLELAYGAGKGLKATAYFWVFPWKVALVIGLIIIILLLAGYLTYRKVKSHQEELEEKLTEEEKEISKLKEELKKE